MGHAGVEFGTIYTWICVVAGVLQVFGQVRRPCSTLIRSRVVSAFEVPAPLDGDQLPT